MQCRGTSTTAVSRAPPTGGEGEEELSLSRPTQDEDDGEVEDGEEESDLGMDEPASLLLREQYGPHAKIVVQRARLRPRPMNPTVTVTEDGQHVVSEELSSNAAAGLYRASSTFKLLGFPVELASVTAPTKDVVLERCLAMSLQSDIPFIDPRKRTVGHVKRRGQRWGAKSSSSSSGLTPHEAELRAIIDELRGLCIHFSRRLKFSVKEPADVNPDRHSSASPPPSPFRCRVYQKDEWNVVARSMFVLESTGATPCKALLQALVTLRASFQQEMGERQHLMQEVSECQALISCVGKKVVAVDVVPERAPRGGNSNNNNNNKDSEALRGVKPPSSLSPSSINSKTNNNNNNTNLEDGEDEASITTDNDPHMALVGMTSFTATLTVEDRFGNHSVTVLRRQRSPYVAYHQMAQQVLRAEVALLPDTHLLQEGLPTPHATALPLLPRLKWQVSLLSQHIAQHTLDHSQRRGGSSPSPDSVVSVAVRGASKKSASLSTTDSSSEEETLMKSVSSRDEEEEEEEALGEVVHDGVGSERQQKRNRSRQRDLFYTATVSVAGKTSVIHQESGSGRYRLTLKAYVAALRYLLHEFPDLCRTLHQQLKSAETLSLFPSSQLLDDALRQHDEFPILAMHKGKWNCFAVLGTLTSSLMGSYYQTTYQPTKNEKFWWAVLTVNTGEHSEEVLIQRSAKMKGEAWRRACTEALRENFPRQYMEAVRVHPDVDLSQDTLAKGSKYRLLPREKRVEHIPNLFAMVCAFAEEDLGWYQPRIRFRNTSMELGFPQWVAELEATVDDDHERRIVAVSPPYPQSRMARRMLIWRLAQRYFPKELEYYKALRRGDSVDPSGGEDDVAERRQQWYKPKAGIGFIDQLLRLMEPNHSAMLPFSWTLNGYVKQVPEAGEESTSPMDVVAGDQTSYLGDGEAAERLLLPLRVQYEAAVLGNHGDLLIADYRGQKVVDEWSPSGRREESAVEVLVTALKTASHHLCKGDSEAMWTEFETHEPPPVPSSRELCLYLFYAFWGSRTYPNQHVLSSASSEQAKNGVEMAPNEARGEMREGAACTSRTAHLEEEALIDAHAVAVGDQWVGTVILPCLGSLPIARAYGSTKKKCLRDALLLAARQCFPQMLHYWMKNVPTASELAKEILSEPIITELPQAVVNDLRRQLRHEQNRSLHPLQRLLSLLLKQFAGARQIRVERSIAAGGEHQCRLYLQPSKRVAQKGSSQLVGFGASRTQEEALHVAACMALENLYDEKYDTPSTKQ